MDESTDVRFGRYLSAPKPNTRSNVTISIQISIQLLFTFESLQLLYRTLARRMTMVVMIEEAEQKANHKRQLAVESVQTVTDKNQTNSINYAG